MVANTQTLDTHALVWFVEGNKRLSEPAKAVIAASDSQMVLPIIALQQRPLSLNVGIQPYRKGGV